MDELKNVPYAVMQRLRFIDFLLCHYGTLNRSVISDYYGLSTPQASNDIRKYIALAPQNIKYDINGKTYRRTPAFKRVWP